MDLTAYFIDGVVSATTPPHETEAAASARREAIVAMVHTFDPADAMEAMVACHCVSLRFLLNATMRDASNTNLEPAMLARTRMAALATSRNLHQWTTRFEKLRKRNVTAAAGSRKTARPENAPVVEPEPETPVAKPAPAQPHQPAKASPRHDEIQLPVQSDRPPVTDAPARVHPAVSFAQQNAIRSNESVHVTWNRSDPLAPDVPSSSSPARAVS